MDKYGATSPAAAEWAVEGGTEGDAAPGTARPVPRARVVGGLVLLAICGLALVAGSVRAPLGPLALDESASPGDDDASATPEDSGNKMSGQEAPIACEAHLRSEVVLKGVEVTNMTSIQKSLLETVAEDAIGKVLNDMTGFQAMTAIWSYPVDGKCWLKFYFQVEFIVIPGDESSDEVSTGEELTNRAMRYLVKKIQNGDLAEQWWESNVQLGSETFLFGGNNTKAEIEDFIDEEMSIYAVDEDTKLLWLETCTPPTASPVAAVATYAPSTSQAPSSPPTAVPHVAPTAAPVTYAPSAAPVLPYPAPTTPPQVSPTPRPTIGPTDRPTVFVTPSPSILPTEWHMTCVPSPCPGRKLNELGEDVPMTKEEAAVQAADEAAAIADMAARAALLPPGHDEQR